MIGKVYKAKVGTPHIVRVLGTYREMLKGESLENTAYTMQVLSQRQSLYIDDDNHLQVFDDVEYAPFCMEQELFLENYEVVP